MTEDRLELRLARDLPLLANRALIPFDARLIAEAAVERAPRVGRTGLPVRPRGAFGWLLVALLLFAATLAAALVAGWRPLPMPPGPGPIAYWTDEGLHVSANAGVGALVVGETDGDYLLWAPDHQHLAVEGQDGTSILSLDGSRMGWIPGPHVVGWSWDGTRLVAADVGVLVSTLRVVNLRGDVVDSVSLPTPLWVPPYKWDLFAAWSPDGSTIALDACLADGCASGEYWSSIQLLASDGSRIDTLGTGWGPTWSSRGALAWSGSDACAPARPAGFPTNCIAVLEPDGTRDAIDAGTPVWGPAWSPDGSRLVFAVRQPDNAVAADTLVTATRRGRSWATTKLEISGVDYAIFPRWSADGTSIIFSGWRLTGSGESNCSLYSVEADGAGLRELVPGPCSWDGNYPG